MWTEVNKLPVVKTEDITDILRESNLDLSKIRKIGLVGSRARGTNSDFSDFDLVIDVDDCDLNETLETFGLEFANYVDRMYGLSINIIPYSLMQERASKPPAREAFWYWQEGYQDMCKDLIWLEG